MTSRVELSTVVDVEPPVVAPAGRLRLLDFPELSSPPVVLDLALQVRTYAGATTVVLPANRQDRKNVGAAYTADGDLIEETQRAKPRLNWWPSPKRLPPGPEATVYLEGTTYYAGRYVGHFGHILLETLTRFWPDVDYASYDHLLAAPKFVQRDWNGHPNSLFNRMLSLAEIPPGRVTVVLDRVVCENLVVASSPLQMAVQSDPQFLNVYNRIGDRVEHHVYGDDLDHLPRRLYLSRTRLEKRNVAGQRAADNEPEVEDLFEQNGFEIIHPQELALTEQVALCRGAEVMAGCDGSALHLAMFSRPGTRLLALDSRAVPNQFMIDQARELDAVHLWAATEDSQRRVKTWRIDTPRVAAAIDVVLDDLG